VTNKLIRFLLSIYVFFVPFGPLVSILGVNFKNSIYTRVDIFCTILATLLFLFNIRINKIFKRTGFYFVLLILYFLMSTIFSINPFGSFSSFFSILFNLLLLNIFLIYFRGDYDYLARVLLFGFLCAGSAVLYQFIINPAAHYTSGRFYLVIDGLSSEELVDPNIQASGMVLAFLANFAYFNFRDFKNILISFYSLILILSNLIIFNSRSAFLGLIVGCLIFIGFKLSAKNLVIYIVSIFVLSFVIYYTLTNFLDLNLVNLIEKFSVSGEDSRFELINESSKIYSVDLIRVLFGLGLDQTNPHNEFLKLIFSLGIIGFVILVFSVLRISRIFLRHLITSRFRFYYFSFFIMTISMFYEHKKLFWVSILLAIL
jgi:hypothetical protein